MNGLLNFLGYSVVLPKNFHFNPNQKFLETIANYKNPLIEMGAGSGFNLACMKAYGKKNGVGHMEHCRGFDLHPREGYFIGGENVTPYTDALEFPYYSDKFTVLVCRPDHSGWFGNMLDNFIHGPEKCKRCIYVGLEENICRDISDDQMSLVTKKYSGGMGEDEEIMLVWEFNGG